MCVFVYIVENIILLYYINNDSEIVIRKYFMRMENEKNLTNTKPTKNLL